MISEFPGKLVASTLLLFGAAYAAEETLPPLEGEKPPQTYEELWADFDPRSEPLDVEVLKEWEEDGVVLKVLRYRVGIFKGKKSMVAAVYGYPKGAEKLPGLVQIHGGGQYADANAVLTNAKRGYATISVSWAGRISAPGYKVGPEVVQLFWDGKTEDPDYKVITDWGGVNAYHAPSRDPGNQFPKIPEPSEWTLDPVVSPRNNSWFLCTMALRRALTFLEQQPQVDGERLGVYGHSMGGKLTVMTAGSDDRVKAAVPSCGGISDRYNQDPLFRATLGDEPYLKRIDAPIMFLSPSNDFHGRINDLQEAVAEIRTDQWRVTCSPHHSHQDSARYEVGTQLWFDQILKGTFEMPATPRIDLDLKGDGGIPVFTVRPDDTALDKIASVDIFYTQQGQDGEGDRDNTVSKYWHHADAKMVDGVWTAELPVLSTDAPLWAYTDVGYRLDEPVSGAGYYYRDYTTDTFNIASLMGVATADELKQAGVKETLEKSLVIESFQGDWKKGWFSYREEKWPITTHKVYDPRWEAPEGAALSLKVKSSEANQLVVAVDDYCAVAGLEGGGDWEDVVLHPADFTNSAGEELGSWEGIRELSIQDEATKRDRKTAEKRTFGGKWKGAAPEFDELKWVSGT